MKTKNELLRRGLDVLSVISAVMGDFRFHAFPERLPVSPEEQLRREIVRNRNAPRNNHLGTGGGDSRQQLRRRQQEGEFKAVRQQFGTGRSSFAYAEGVTRRSARKIARGRMKLAQAKAARA